MTREQFFHLKRRWRSCPWKKLQRKIKESKSADIDSVTQRPDPKNDNVTERTNQSDPKRRTFQTSDNCGYCNHQNPPGKRNCLAAETRCNKCNNTRHFPIICRLSTPVNMVNQVLQTEADVCPTFVREVSTPTCSNTCRAEQASHPQTVPS